MCSRRSSIARFWVPLRPNVARRTTRNRNGSLRGAPASRWPWWYASTSWTTIVGVAELGAAQHRLQPLDQRAVAAPVGAQCLLVARGLGGPQIGDDVAAAERVDRLLRVADQDQRGAAAEGAVDHLPLHGIGVLELVDHHDRPALMHARTRAGESSASSAAASRLSRSS